MSKKLVIIVGLAILLGGFLLYLYRSEPVEVVDVVEELVSESPEQIQITATMIESRTYGRVFLKNQDNDSEYAYILAEPTDVISDGGVRYSPTTQDMSRGNTYEIHGIISDPCFDRYEVIDGEGKVCLAWMNLASAAEIEM